MKWVAVLLLITSPLIAECDWYQIFHCSYVGPNSEASGFCNGASGLNSRVSSGCCLYASGKDARADTGCCIWAKGEGSHPGGGCCLWSFGQESNAYYGCCLYTNGFKAKAKTGCCNFATQKAAKIEAWRAPSCCNFVNAEYSKADCCCNYISGRESQAEGFGSVILGQKSHSDGCCLCVVADRVDMQDSFCSIALEKFSDFPKSLCCEIGSSNGISYCCRPYRHEVIVKKFKKSPQSEKQKGPF